MARPEDSAASDPPRYMRAKEASQYLGLSESALAKLRMGCNRLRGPNFVKVAGCIVYRRADLDRWVEDHLIAE